jgi:type IV pilus assembly protein PilN
MYSLDVNFLTDRNLEIKGPVVAATADGPSLQQQLPIYIGAGVMVVLPLLAGLSLLFVGWQKEQAQANIQTLEAELAKLNAQNKKIQEIEGKIKTIDDDIAGLVGVFNQIKPWSAILQDLTDQTPATVQISGG